MKLIIFLIAIMTLSLLMTNSNVSSVSQNSVYNMYGFISCGTVTGKDTTGYEDISGPVYTISLEKNYKGNLNSTLVAIGSEDTNGPRSMIPLEVGDKAIFYVDFSGKYYLLSPYTAVVSKCGSDFIATPLGQARFGIDAINIICMDDHYLIQKASNGLPACVKPDSADDLIKRGWANCYDGTYSGKGTCPMVIVENVITDPPFFGVTKGNQIFYVDYFLKHGTISEAVYNTERKNLLLKINSTEFDELIVTLPRELIDSKMGYCPPDPKANDESFIATSNFKELQLTEIKTTPESRTLKIHLNTLNPVIEINTICLI